MIRFLHGLSRFDVSTWSAGTCRKPKQELTTRSRRMACTFHNLLPPFSSLLYDIGMSHVSPCAPSLTLLVFPNQCGSGLQFENIYQSCFVCSPSNQDFFLDEDKNWILKILLHPSKARAKLAQISGSKAARRECRKINMVRPIINSGSLSSVGLQRTWNLNLFTMMITPWLHVMQTRWLMRRDLSSGF